MKKLISILLIAVVFIVGCADTKVIKGVEYDTFGLITQSDKRNPDIQYELVWGNIIWGILLIETIIAPIYFWGFSIWEPVGVKTTVKGQIIK